MIGRGESIYTTPKYYIGNYATPIDVLYNSNVVADVSSLRLRTERVISNFKEKSIKELHKKREKKRKKHKLFLMTEFKSCSKTVSRKLANNNNKTFLSKVHPE